MAGVQIDVVGAGLGHAGDDGLGHDVPRREVRKIMDTLHEPHPVAVDQESAFATHRLGEERLLAARSLTQPKHRGVELDEFEVGDHGTRPQGRRNPITGGHRRVRCGRINLPDPARGQDDGSSTSGAHAIELALADHV